MSTANESAIVSGRSPPRVVTRRATDSFLIGYLPERTSRGEATAMSPEDGSDASSPEDRDVKGTLGHHPAHRGASGREPARGEDRFRHGNGPRRSGVSGIVPGERFARLDLYGHSPKWTSKGLDHEEEDYY